MIQTTTMPQVSSAKLFRQDNPLLWLVGDWLEVAFIHYRVPAEILQPHVPYPLDLFEGDAYVSLVAFTLNRMRPNIGGKTTELLFRLIATHQFLNVRTYVVVNGEPGIMFLAEILNNKLSIPLGPAVYALPYKLGKIRYRHDEKGFAGEIRSEAGGVSYSGVGVGAAGVAEEGSLDAFLLERYSAFNETSGRRKMFRVDHKPWQASRAEVTLHDESLLRSWYPWFEATEYCGAHVSKGVTEVKMGLPSAVGADWSGEPRKIQGS
ncbi:MAG: hypothetical protein JWN25_3426 [Verrucomicrobiales bacterium]|nr:hypothetical protein [Verrucomicrobiales bacterium]